MPKRKSDTKTKQPTSEPSSASKKTSKSRLIEDLNALNHKDFTTRFTDGLKHKHGELEWQPTLYFAHSLPAETLQLCFKLIETTSRHDYEPSSFGWHPVRKRREMKEKEMRYLILDNGTPEGLDGFLSFMFTHDSTPSVPVLYIYEVHLEEAARGKGLGGFLMRAAESMAREAGVEKVMLTCFLSNENALAFYQKLGFEVDVSSPGDRKTRNKVVETDYVIMSKEVSSEWEDVGEDVSVEVTQAILGAEDPLETADMASQGKRVSDVGSSAISLEAVYSKVERLLDLSLSRAEVDRATPLQVAESKLQAIEANVKEVEREGSRGSYCSGPNAHECAAKLIPLQSELEQAKRKSHSKAGYREENKRNLQELRDKFENDRRRLREYQAREKEIKEQEEELDAQEAALYDREEKLEYGESELKELENDLNDREEDRKVRVELIQEENVMTKREESVEKREREVKSREDHLDSIRRKTREEQVRLTHAQEELAEKKSIYASDVRRLETWGDTLQWREAGLDDGDTEVSDSEHSATADMADASEIKKEVTSTEESKERAEAQMVLKLLEQYGKKPVATR